MIYSFDAIQSKQIAVDGVSGTIQFITSIRIQTPPGFVLERVRDVNPDGDTGFEQMVFDPIETERGNSGRVYLRAARLVERMRLGIGNFIQVT